MNIYRSEASASQRRIPLWLVGSNGTSPATGEAGGQPQINWLARGTATVNTAATLSLVSANAGEYYVELAASEVSATGMAAVHYRSATAIPNSSRVATLRGLLVSKWTRWTLRCERILAATA